VKAKKPGTRKGKKEPGNTKLAPQRVDVRMYNVGFGDCFLLKVAIRGQKTLKILVDCGSHSAGPGPKPIHEVVRQVVDDVTENGKASIDVVIATHRHQDHVSGFDSPLWNEVEVREVWMPWTEDPSDPLARKIRDTQSRVASHLVEQIKALGLGPELQSLAGNSLTNAKAMRTLHEGFSGNPARRYLPKKEGTSRCFRPKCLPGMKVHVLGPSRDESVVRDMNPPAGQSYLQVRELEVSTAANNAFLPFRPNWKTVADTYRLENSDLALRSRELDIIGKIGTGEEFAVAVALDKAVNGTSLMLMLQIKEAYLLLTGDAQWGTWNNVLQDPHARELLTKTTFHKIGHHGSHNASPKEFVDEVLPADVFAMASTRTMERWKYIPKEELLAALRKKSKRVVRSDQADPKDSVEFRRFLGEHSSEGGLWVDASIPI
jgi:beta-lactamase superfamily II metal-dependent hydrolase